MQISALREYVEFAKYLNFSTAAKKLYLSQPALSNHIANIEKELGLDLVCRDPVVELTAAGKAFFEGCCTIIAAYDRTLEHVQSLGSSEQQGMLTIKMPFDGSSGSVRLAELIGDFKRANPAVNIKFAKESRNSVIDDLVSGAIDCAQLLNFSADSEYAREAELDCIVIDHAPITLVARADHPLMAEESLSIEDVAGFPYAMPAGVAFTECDLSVRQIYAAHGLTLDRVHYKMVDTITDLVVSGVDGDEILFLGPSPALTKGMAYRAFQPEVLQDFCLAYRRDNDDPALLALLEHIRATMCEPGRARVERSS